jgi:hypothetical protein
VTKSTAAGWMIEYVQLMMHFGYRNLGWCSSDGWEDLDLSIGTSHFDDDKAVA